MKKKLVIILLPIFIIGIVGVALFSAFTYANIWKVGADFITYEKEFTLVKDFVKIYSEEETITLSISFSAENKYDLYDSKKGVYLDCPDEIKKA